MCDYTVGTQLRAVLAVLVTNQLVHDTNGTTMQD